MSETHKPKIAILASGSGSTAKAFIQATYNGRVDAEVGLVICNNPREKAGIWDRIDKLNALYSADIEVREISGKTHPKGKLDRGQTLQESEAICEAIRNGGFAHVALMGYMKAVNGDLLTEYGWSKKYSEIWQARMSNTHPGILPDTADTFGIHASERVLELGLPQTAHTVHLVAPKIDDGPIIAKHLVDVIYPDPEHDEPGDTPKILFDRVQAVEKIGLSYALNKFLQDQIEFNQAA